MQTADRADERADERPAALRRDRRAVARVAALALLAGIAVAVVLALHTTDAYDRTGGHEMRFGAPFAALTQDQSDFDPPSGTRLGLSSPWEHPTHVRVLPAAADIVLLAVAAAVLLGAGRLLVRRARRTTQPGPSRPPHPGRTA
ncbi:hypothetical protein P5P86_05600 [Nocardioides sp. BP30]|uniref:hypothetical protein n=1 Tax=Nocardioides sp. BP30 TaxID=3036374 RepID=UPI0024682B89|nr:hypothetical protein [Nocardioides sp. BP30]WGL53300.1 hypothetical protein P5P86_05600 [Nocardioides sp. BP30]